MQEDGVSKILRLDLDKVNAGADYLMACRGGHARPPHNYDHCQWEATTPRAGTISSAAGNQIKSKEGPATWASFQLFQTRYYGRESSGAAKRSSAVWKDPHRLFQSIVNTLTNAQIDDDQSDRLEEQLILADVGPACAVRLVDEPLHDQVE